MYSLYESLVRYISKLILFLFTTPQQHGSSLLTEAPKTTDSKCASNIEFEQPLKCFSAFSYPIPHVPVAPPKWRVLNLFSMFPPLFHS
jgi:hypothetical protein